MTTNRCTFLTFFTYSVPTLQNCRLFLQIILHMAVAFARNFVDAAIARATHSEKQADPRIKKVARRLRKSNLLALD